MLTRRHFLASGLALGGMPLLVRDQTPPAADVFRHGVASGDPLTDRVVLWTRVTPPPGHSGPIDVEWMIARDPRMSRVIDRGSARTSAARDFTVKVDAAGLDPASTYYYRFAARRERSPIGRTRTLPAANARRVRVALASCANYPFGFFNVYGRIAARADLDAVLHLGDYFYEYANANYGNRAGRGRRDGARPHPRARTARSSRSTTTAAATRSTARTPICRRLTASTR